MTSKDASEPAKPPKTPPSTAGMTTKVVKGSLWTLAGQVAPLAVSLVATPFVIRMLGAESYGVLILVGLIPTYLGFADFGMSMASTKFGSEAYAEGDEEKEARIVRTAALSALMTSVPVAAALIIFASPVIALFNVPEALQAEAITALRIAAVTFVINFLCGIFNTPQLARLRMDLNTFINAGSRILGLIATPIVLYLGYGIIGAVTVLLAASLLNLLGHLVASRKHLLTLFGLRIEPSLLPAMAKFGFGVIAAGIAGLLLANVEKGVLSSLGSVKELAFYSVAFIVASSITMFSSAMSQSLMPAFSQLNGSDPDNASLRFLFSTVVRLNIMWLLPASVFLILVAEPFFTIWAGPEFGQGSTAPFYVLLIGLSFHVITYIPFTLLMAVGRSDLIAKIYWAELLPYLLLVWTLVAQYGAVGAATAWSIRIIADCLILLFATRWLTGIRLELLPILRILLTGSILMVPGILMFVSSLPISAIGLVYLLFAGLYGFLLWRFVFTESEIDWLRLRFSGRSSFRFNS